MHIILGVIIGIMIVIIMEIISLKDEVTDVLCELVEIKEFLKRNFNFLDKEKKFYDDYMKKLIGDD